MVPIVECFLDECCMLSYLKNDFNTLTKFCLIYIVYHECAKSVFVEHCWYGQNLFARKTFLVKTLKIIWSMKRFKSPFLLNLLLSINLNALKYRRGLTGIWNNTGLKVGLHGTE